MENRLKFYEYIKKHKVVNDEDLAFVKEREDNLYGDQKPRPHVSDRFQLIHEVGHKPVSYTHLTLPTNREV